MIALPLAASTAVAAVMQLGPLVLLVVLYARRARTLARTSHPVPRWRQACFYAGFAVIGAALTGLDRPSQDLLYMHMVEHLLLSDVAALLIVLGLTGPVLAPILTAPAWLFGTVGDSFRAVQVINSVAVSLAAVPVYLLARQLSLGRRGSLAAAALALLVPSLIYSSYILAEPIAYPLVLAAVATGVRALDRPSRSRIAVFVVLVLPEATTTGPVRGNVSSCCSGSATLPVITS